MSYHESDSDYTNYLEMRADFEQANAEERRRYEAEHPLWDKCRNHPDRQAIGPHSYDTQFCAECRENNLRNYADAEPIYRGDPVSEWILGAGDQPSLRFKEKE